MNTKIKLCGLMRLQDVDVANELKPDYVGFVFYKKKYRYVTPDFAKEMRNRLDPSIQAVGVFVDEDLEFVASLLNDGVIDVAQLHGKEDQDYIERLREMTGKQIAKAFCIRSKEDLENAEKSTADMIFLDSGKGSGKTFDWSLLEDAKRPYFLAGGLDCENISEAIRRLQPFGVDVSSGIETDKMKDRDKMAAFVMAVREGGNS